MIKRALPAVAVLLGLSFSLGAQQVVEEAITRDDLRSTGEVDAAGALALYRPDLFNTVDGTVLIHGLPVLTLLDGRRFPISNELGRMGMTPFDLFPAALLSAVEVQPLGSSARYGSDAPGGVVNLRLNRNYSGGEAGLFYGKSGGKYGREDKEAYIIGSTGNDKFQITAGASYQESSGHYPQFGRAPR